jgi:hypothetical protein
MPVTIASVDAGKTAAGSGSNPVLWAGSAGVFEHELSMQFAATPPWCMSMSQPGQTAPLLMPAWAGPCICAAIAALDPI